MHAGAVGSSARGGDAGGMTAAAPIDEQQGAHGLKEGLERFRAVRRELEASVLPLASSLDGRRFTFQASLHGLDLRLGGYVVVEHDGPPRLGPVLAPAVANAEGAQRD